MKSDDIRNDILNTVGDYAEKVFNQNLEFIPSKTHVPVSGKLIGKEEIQLAVDACLDGWFTSGRFSKQFEKEFSTYMEQRYCVLTNSGSSANLLALSALTSPQLEDRKLNKGDEIITVAAGFPTTVNPIIQNGLVPVFIDVNLDDYGIQTDQLELAYSKKVKGIMLAHTLGNPFNIKKVKDFAEKYNLWLIEDCCDAVGSTYDGKMVGTFGDLATVSFYPAHHITMGEGGAVLTNQPKLRKIVESFRDWGRDCWCATGEDNTCGKRFDWQLGELPQGFDHKYIYSHIGYNLKITDMQAAIGLAQLKKVDDFISMRKRNFRFLYENLLSLNDKLAFPKVLDGADASWFGFPIRIRDHVTISRNKIIQLLDEKNIGTRLLFGGNLLKQPLYRDIEYRKIDDLKNTEIILKNVFWVGVQPSMTKEMLLFIVQEISKIFGK